MSNVEVKVVGNMTPPTGGGANRGGVGGKESRDVGNPLRCRGLTIRKTLSVPGFVF